MKVLLSAVVTLKHELIVDLVAAKAAKFGGWWRDRGDWLNVCAFHHSSVKDTFLNAACRHHKETVSSERPTGTQESDVLGT
jgi:hypothetical protein